MSSGYFSAFGKIQLLIGESQYASLWCTAKTGRSERWASRMLNFCLAGLIAVSPRSGICSVAVEGDVVVAIFEAGIEEAILVFWKT